MLTTAITSYLKPRPRKRRGLSRGDYDDRVWPTAASPYATGRAPMMPRGCRLLSAVPAFGLVDGHDLIHHKPTRPLADHGPRNAAGVVVDDHRALRRHLLAQLNDPPLAQRRPVQRPQRRVKSCCVVSPVVGVHAHVGDLANPPN